MKHRGGRLNSGLSFRPADCPKSGLPRCRRVQRRSLTYASPDQTRYVKAGAVVFARVMSRSWGPGIQPRDHPTSHSAGKCHFVEQVVGRCDANLRNQDTGGAVTRDRS